MENKNAFENTGELPQNYKGTVETMRLLKESPSQAYAQALEVVRSILRGDRPSSVESGYDGWSEGNLKQLLEDLEESE